MEITGNVFIFWQHLVYKAFTHSFPLMFDQDKIKNNALASAQQSADMPQQTQRIKNLHYTTSSDASAFDLAVLYTVVPAKSAIMDEVYVVAAQVCEKLLRLTTSTYGRCMQDPHQVSSGLRPIKSTPVQLAALQRVGAVSNISQALVYMFPISQ